MRRWAKYVFFLLSFVMAAEMGIRLYHDGRGALASRPAAEKSARSR